MTTGSPVTLSAPLFSGLSAHTVESNVVASGATRFVVYSPGNTPISSNGEVTVDFEAVDLPHDGMITISGVMASNSQGMQVDAQPNALPIRTLAIQGNQSIQVGVSNVVSADIVDPDGSVSSLVFKVSGAEIGTAPGNSQSVNYTPAAPGFFPLSVVATDAAGGVITLDLGQLRAYRLADISSLQAFRDIHYGGVTDSAVIGLDADPFAIGIPNGIAFVLGINPRSPDHSRLPSAKVEPDGAGGHRLVFRFTRPNGISAHAWTITESSGLSGWTVVPSGQIIQTPVADGFTEVIVRRAIPAVPGGAIFMQLEALE